MKGEYIRIPLADLQQPKNGFVVMTDRWWVIDNGHALGYKLSKNDRPSPQCNPHKAVVDHILTRHPGHEAQFIPVAYWWPDRS